jgi:hypothetical protein
MTDLATPDSPPSVAPAVVVDASLPPPNWLQALSYSANIDRYLIDAAWGQSGVLAGLAVSQRAAGANMSVDVAAGQAVVAGTDAANQASYLVRLLAAYNVPVAAAPPAGQTRIDLIVAAVNDPAATGTGTAGWGFSDVQGVPASSNPDVPATPASSVVLAQVTVAAGTASITGALITDRRTILARLNRAFPAVTGAGVNTYVDPFGDTWVAKAGVRGGAWLRPDDVLHARVFQNGAFASSASPPSQIVYDTVAFGSDPYGLYSTGTGQFTCPLAGVYAVTAKLALTATAAGQWAGMLAVTKRAGVLSQQVDGGYMQVSTAITIHALVHTVFLVAANDTLQAYLDNSTVLNGVPGAVTCWANFDYLGTG